MQHSRGRLAVTAVIVVTLAGGCGTRLKDSEVAAMRAKASGAATEVAPSDQAAPASGAAAAGDPAATSTGAATSPAPLATTSRRDGVAADSWEFIAPLPINRARPRRRNAAVRRPGL